MISASFDERVALDARDQDIQNLIFGELQFVQNPVVHLFLQIR
jgi:hypothetical protein